MDRGTLFFIFLLIIDALFVFYMWKGFTTSSLLPRSLKSAKASSRPGRPIGFSGVIRDINGNVWTINNQTFIVRPSDLQDRTFAVGSLVKVQGTVTQNGTFLVTSIDFPELPNTSGRIAISNIPSA